MSFTTVEAFVIAERHHRTYEALRDLVEMLRQQASTLNLEPDLIVSELARLDQLAADISTLFDDIAAHAIAEGWTADTLGRAVAHAVRSST